MKKKKNSGIIIIIIILIGIIAVLLYGKIIKEGKETNVSGIAQGDTLENVTEEEIEKEKVDIIDVNSKSRPYAIMINNTPVAVKVQTGLNKAYLVYELPTEGSTSRLMALYKDIPEDLTIGTIRSARHNFIDYALESDAIFIHYGWSHYAEDQEKAGVIDYINGLFDKPFWRENPEKLAVEHTAYTSIDKLKETITSKKFKNTTESKTVLNYNIEDVDLSEKEDAIIAEKITIPYDARENITSFIYDSDKRMYSRIEAGKPCIDYKTKEQVDTKNIIVQKVDYKVCSDNYYWDLKTVGSGEGYFITNGYAVPITWKKSARAEKTKYFYKDETEIEVSDGRTYIELQTTKQNLTIE